MPQLVLSGSLKGPTGEPAANAEITFTSRRTTDIVLQQTVFTARADAQGDYQIALEYGVFDITVKLDTTTVALAHRVSISEQTTATTLNQLIIDHQGEQALTPKIIVEFRELTAEARGYRDEAAASAQSASEDATATAADRQAVANDRAHVDQQRQAVDTTADEVEADRLAAQQARTGAEDAQGASEIARDESRSWATGDGVIDTIGGTDRYSARAEADRASDERQGAEDAATAAADSETNAAGSAQTALEQANRAESEANRATTYADNAGYVTRQRLAEQSTLGLSFARGKYLVDDGELTETTNASEILSVERASPKWVEGPNGYLREVPPNTIARHWGLVSGEPLGMLSSEAWTNLIPWSETDGSNWPVSNNAADWAGTPTVMRGITLDRYTKASPTLRDVASASTIATWKVLFYDGGEDTNDNRVFQVAILGDSAISRGVYFDYTTKEFSLSTISGVEELSVDDLGGGLYQVTVTINDPSIINVTTLRTAIYGNNKWLGGFVVKEGGPVADYIKTEDTAVTCEADDPRRLFGGEFNPREGSFFIEITPEELANNRFFFAFQSDANDQILAAYYNASGTVSIAGPSTSIRKGSAAVAGQSFKLLVTYSNYGDSVSAWINGQLMGSSENTGIDMRIVTQLRVGRSYSARHGSYGMHVGPIKECWYCPFETASSVAEELTQ